MNVIGRRTEESTIYFIGECVEHGRWSPPNTHPLVHYQQAPQFVICPQANSVEALKDKLRDMLEACEGPVFILQPERLVPAELKKA